MPSGDLPKTIQNRPKSLPRGKLFPLKFQLRFGIDFGAILAPKMPPFGHPRASKIVPETFAGAPKMLPRGPKTSPRGSKDTQREAFWEPKWYQNRTKIEVESEDEKKTLLGAPWIDFGSFWEATWGETSSKFIGGASIL